MTSADRGLRAVARVRSVREQDSRLGLQQALARLAELVAQARALRTELDDAVRGLATGSYAGAEFAARRAAVDALGHALRETEDAAEVTRTLVLGARERWQLDKSRLRAVEILLEHREEERRRERQRAEARELDDVAGRAWLRQTRAAESADPHRDGRAS